MIDISASTAFMIYIGATLSALMGIWLAEMWRSKQRTVDAEPEKLLTCEFCRFVYLGDVTQQITQCPQCNSFNKNNRYQNGSRYC